MPFLSNKLKGYYAHPLKSFYKVNSQLMKKRFFQVVLRLYYVYGIQKFVILAAVSPAPVGADENGTAIRTWYAEADRNHDVHK